MNDYDTFLVCAMADAEFTVKGASFDHCCCACESKVMIAPSGLKRLGVEKNIGIICVKCMLDMIRKGVFKPELDIAIERNSIQEAMNAIRNMHRQKN